MNERQQLQFELTKGMLPCTRQWQQVVQLGLGNHGVSSACITPLLLIGRSGGGLRQVDLAQQLGMKGPSLVPLLDKLAAMDLLRRESDTTDRRAKLLWLTEAGQRRYVELEQGVIALREKVLADMSDAELQAVLKLYRLIEAAARIA